MLVSSKGIFPHAIMYTITPILHMSDDLAQYGLPCKISGEAYAELPQNVQLGAPGLKVRVALSIEEGNFEESCLSSLSLSEITSSDQFFRETEI